MKNTTYKSNIRQRIFLAFLIVSVLTGISFLINHTILAESENKGLLTQKNDDAPNSFIAPRGSAPTANIGERNSVWIKLQEGKSLDTTFYGNDSAISSLQSDLAEPLSQAAADFNSDGYPDLVSGFRNNAGGGLIALHRASREAFMPQDPQILAGIRNGVFPNSFEKDASIIEVPTAPDFIVTGKFTQDSAVDLVFASRGGSSIYLMISDGKGGFGAPQEIPVGGEITALAADLLNFKTTTYIGVVAAVRSEKSSYLTVFDGRQELGKAAPRNVKIDGDVTSLVIASPYGGATAREVYGLADGGVFSVRGIETRNPSINKIELPFRSNGIAVGNFIADRQARAEIAVLAENGNVAYLTHGSLDTRAFTAKEMHEFYETHTRGVDSPVAPITDDLVSENWQISEEQQLGVYALGENNSRALQKAYITGNETEDLLVTDSQNKQIQILFKEPNYDENRTAFTGETKTQSVSFTDSPAAVLPMRLNVMGQQGFVYFGKGSIEPTPVMLVPNATFTVSKTADTNDGTCNADCSVREAIVAANAAAGTDMVTFGVNGTHTHTIAGNDDTAATGDLDVTQALTIMGNGTANTVIQAGATQATGIDKVFSVNPTLAAGFATSFTGLTIQNGNNNFTGVARFGGAMDWDGRAVGTLSLSNVIITNNIVQNYFGGGVFASGSAGSSLVTVTNSTISNNTARGGGVTTPLGAGLTIEGNVGLNMTSSIVTGNNATNTSNNTGVGGGVHFRSTVSGAGRPFFTNSSISNNTAAGFGGGISTDQGIDINPVCIISNNNGPGTLAGFGGGGIYIGTSGNTVISKVTMVGNSTGTSGGAIFLDNGGSNPTLNMTFSRITGNTATTSFSGVAVNTASASATVENNWWGCNTGPNTAGCDGVGTISTGSFDFNPWLRYTHTASPNSIQVGQTSTLTASFLTNSDGTAIPASNLNVLIGLPITFNMPVRGTISSPQPTIQASGTATATFNATTAGAGSANAVVDNGTATANITILAIADLGITKTDGVTTAVPGGSVTYTITAFNASASSATGATVADTFPAVLTGTWTCVGAGGGTCTAAGAGNINDTVNLPAGASVTYTVTATISPAATGTLSNTATVTLAGDPNSANNSATDTDTLTPQANLGITKTDGVTTVTAGGSTTYTITASNAGPSNAPGATVADTFPAVLTGTWTCVGAGGGTCTAAGAGNINDTVNLPAGGSVTYTVSAAISSMATGTLTNTATVSAPAGVTDPVPGNNSATDSDTIMIVVAAGVSVSGRVLDQKGVGINNALVVLTDPNGRSVIRRTNSFGYYRFDDVEVGRNYVISVNYKSYRFNQRIISVNDNLQNEDFIAIE